MSRNALYRRPDARSLQAKALGYPARSIFKLQEIDRRLGLFKPGQQVLDLGAAPGSWSMYAYQRVGPSGRVVAVDLQAIRHPLGVGVVTIQADVRLLGSAELLPFAPFDVVLSDMAPRTTGVHTCDQAASHELFMVALRMARQFARPGAAFVGKIFMGPDLESAEQALGQYFAKVRTLRPAGTRKTSSEVFLAGLGFRP